MESKKTESMGVKILIGALLGWIGAFSLVCLIAGEFPDDLTTIKFILFLSLAPGVIIGVIVTYIVNKVTNTNVPTVKDESREERLIKLKSLLDQGILSKEEFEEQKKRILEK